MKITRLLLPISLVLLAAAGCASKPAGAPLAAKAANTTSAPLTKVENPGNPALLQPSNTLFTLGPGDALEIEVLGSPSSRAIVPVGLDGKIYYQVLPGLDVWGLTLRQASEVLEKELDKYIPTPQVTVSLRTVGSKFVWVLGRLNHPGIYPLMGPTTLLESIADAGGTASGTPTGTEDLADLRHSFVMRHGQLLPVDFHRLLRDGDMTQNIQLQPDDFVYVPSSLSHQVYVLGAVHSPRAVVYHDAMTVISAIAAANGPARFDYLTSYYQGRTPDAYLSHIAILRGSLAEPQIAIVSYIDIVKGRSPDVRLEPGDIVYVPNSPLRTVKSYVNMMVNAFVTTVAANEGVKAGGGTTGVSASVPVGGR